LPRERRRELLRRRSRAPMTASGDPMPSPLLVRDETAADADAVRSVVDAAFGRRAEMQLVERLRTRADAIARVAIEGGELLGHSLFVPVELIARPMPPQH